MSVHPELPGVEQLPAVYEPLMDLAIKLRRNKEAKSRADAIEQAYDALLNFHSGGRWERVGEVFLNDKGQLQAAKFFVAACRMREEVGYAA